MIAWSCIGRRGMPPTPDRSQSSHAPSPGRRILNIFNAKPRNIPEFEVRLNDPHKQYFPGDIVPGHVFLRVTKPTRVTHIIVRLHGYAQVYKNPGSPGDGYKTHASYLTTHRGSRSGEYFGNGFASLFEDEQVLCGDGRLAEGPYQFDFELEFPDRDLPSSIEFERGTICYLATAIMTRPTTMSPTITDHTKVYFVERIDIAPIFPPKPRTVILAPVPKRIRAKAQARRLVDSSDRRSRNTESVQRGSDAPRHSDASSMPPSSNAEVDPSVSGVPSEISFDSSSSSQERFSRLGSYGLASPTTSDAAFTRASTSRASLVQKVIHTTVETQAGGCLRGDSIPIKINVSHTKQVKSVHGVIVTLYRMSRVDMRPSIPLGPTEKGKDAKYEDYYPRSVTGLGGLSLSGAGSSHVFRKDLSQTIAPLYIDPQTLCAEVHTKVRIPEEAFPTISTVPGQMISFKYYIEVVIDVQGRLSSSDRTLSNLPGQAGVPNQIPNFDGADTERSTFAPFGSPIIDTSHIRRDKGVVDIDFEVVVGTKDSDRKKGKRRMIDSIAVPATPTSPQQLFHEDQQTPNRTQAGHNGYDWYDGGEYEDPRWYDQQYWYYNEGYQQYPENGDLPPPPHDYDVPPPLPMPQPEDESQMSEKERIRQAETRLLPSQPPGEEPDQVAGASSSAPSAPYIPEESGDPSVSTANHHPRGQAAGPSAPILENGNILSHQWSQPQHLPSVPAYESPTAASSTHTALASSDDKQEMQRQRLEAEASGPPVEDADAPTGSHSSAPSAPTWGEIDGLDHAVHDSHADATGSATLPRYER